MRGLLTLALCCALAAALALAALAFAAPRQIELHDLVTVTVGSDFNVHISCEGEGDRK